MLIDICNGVIAYFYRKYDDTGLYHSSGSYCKNFFQKTLMEEIFNHINKLTLEDLEKELEFIKKALLSTAGIKDFQDFKKKFNFKTFEKY